MKTLLLAPRFASLLIPVSRTACCGIVGSFLWASPSFGQSGYQYQGPQASSPYASGGPAAYQQPSYPQQSPYQQWPNASSSRPAAPKPQKPAYNPGAYDQIQQPYSYPAGNAAASAKRPLQGPVYQYAPKPTSNRPVNQPMGNSRSGSSPLAQEIAALKASQRQLDRRVDALEAGTTTGGSYMPGKSGDNYRKHKVEYGDSLQDLATHYGVSVAQIKTLNHLSSNQLSEGQVLKIPAKSSSKSPAGTFVSSRGNGTHVVQRGESLSQIASQYGLSPSALQKANGIRNPDLLVVGQKLVLPGRAGKGNAGTETMRKTTVASTSKKDTTRYVDKSSKPKSTTLYADTAPPLPGAGIGSGAIPAPTGSRGITSYRVEPGDSIESVARMFGTSSSEIQRKNKLPSTKLPPPGDEIVVPQPGSVSS